MNPKLPKQLHWLARGQRKLHMTDINEAPSATTARMIWPTSACRPHGKLNCGVAIGCRRQSKRGTEPMAERRATIRLRAKDQERVDIVRGVYDGLNITQVIRMGLMALCRQLGFEKDPQDLLKK
jgi:hypothetical protein